MYAVVTFVEEEDLVEVVPMSWVSDTHESTSWPPLKGTALIKAIERRAPPEAGWVMHPICLLVQTESYEKARRKCRKVIQLNTSDLHMTDDNAKRISQKRIRIGEESNSSEKEEATTPVPKKACRMQKRSIPPLPELPELPEIQMSNSLCYASSSYKEATPSTPRQTHSLSATSLCYASSSHKEATPSRPRQTHSLSVTRQKERELFASIEEIKGTLRQHTLLLETLMHRQQLVRPMDNDSLAELNLPLCTEEDVVQLERLIKEKSKEKLLIYFFHIVEWAMTALFSNALTKMFNWKGKGLKTGLAKLTVAKVIKDAARKVHITEADCEKEIQKWLKYSSDREGGREKRAENKAVRDAFQRAEAARRDLATSESE